MLNKNVVILLMCINLIKHLTSLDGTFYALLNFHDLPDEVVAYGLIAEMSHKGH